MPYSARYIRNGADVRFTGVATGAEIVEAKVVALAHAYAAGPEFLLFDFAAVDQLEVATADLRRLALQDRSYTRSHGGLTIAVVAPQPLTFGLSRMWQVYVDGSGVRSAIVRSRAEALDWLGRHGVTPDEGRAG